MSRGIYDQVKEPLTAPFLARVDEVLSVSRDVGIDRAQQDQHLRTWAGPKQNAGDAKKCEVALTSSLQANVGEPW